MKNKESKIAELLRVSKLKFMREEINRRVCSFFKAVREDAEKKKDPKYWGL